jgi:hypothetical protein
MKCRGQESYRYISPLLHSIQHGSGANTVSYPMVSEDLPKRIKRPKRNADHSPGPSPGVKSRIAIYFPLHHSVQTGLGAKTTSYPMVSGALPKGIKRPKRGADNSLTPRAEVKNGRAIYLFSSSVQTGSETNKVSYPMVKGAHPKGIKRPKLGANTHLDTVPSSKNRRASYLLFPVARPAL